MPIRIPAAVGIAVACLCGGGFSAEAQVVEPDAPERAIAGCYSTHLEAAFPVVDPLPGREDRYQLADTIHLTLQLRTLGTALARSSDWRENWYFLGVDPPLMSPGALHRYEAWQLDGTGFRVTWNATGDSMNLSLNARDQDGAWRGVATLAVAERSYQRSIVLRPVECPAPEYWREQRSRILTRWTPLSDVSVEVGPPITAPPAN